MYLVIFKVCNPEKNVGTYSRAYNLIFLRYLNAFRGFRLTAALVLQRLKRFSSLPFSLTDNDLQGSDGSGSLGGPDVRRRIPIKLISKQPLRSKPQPRSQRPSRPIKSEAGENGRNSLQYTMPPSTVF